MQYLVYIETIMLSLDNFDEIMDKVQADVELAILKEKFWRLQQQRSDATKRYIAKMRENQSGVSEIRKEREPRKADVTT
jgi:hypothetical protein